VFEEKEPFAEKTVPEIMMAKVIQKQGETLSEKTPENLHKLLKSCWDEAGKRPTAEEILEFFETLPQELENKQALLEAVQKGDLETLKELISLEEKARAPQLGPTVPSQTIVPEIAFGAADWNTYFGDVGVEPPLPPNIEEILQNPCPFWPEKKVKDTHFLCLIPKTVRKKPLTLDRLQRIVKHPKQGTPTTYRNYASDVQKEHGSTPVEQSHWVLMTKDVIPDSRGKSYDEQKALLEKEPNYQLPPVLEAATVIFMHTYKAGGYIYTDGKLGPQLYMRCLEKVNKGNWPVVAGDLSAAGLSVGSSHFDRSIGAAGFRKFP
jgi:hypothetical protein